MPAQRQTISDAAIAGYAKNAGFTGDALVKAVAIALGESGGNIRAHNTNAATGDNSYGLWQINMLGSMGPARRRQFGISSNDQLFDPAINAKAAYAVSNGGKNFRPWSVYTSGKYLSYMPRARTAAGNPDTSGGSTGVEQAGLGDVFSWPGEILDFFEFITDPNTWLRLGMIIAGGGLVLFALFAISGQADKLKKTVDTVTDFLPQTRGLKAAAKAA
jgi:hypothetical protein